MSNLAHGHLNLLDIFFYCGMIILNRRVQWSWITKIVLLVHGNINKNVLNSWEVRFFPFTFKKNSEDCKTSLLGSCKCMDKVTYEIHEQWRVHSHFCFQKKKKWLKRIFEYFKRYEDFLKYSYHFINAFIDLYSVCIYVYTCMYITSFPLRVDYSCTCTN